MRCDRPPDRDPRLVLAHAFASSGVRFFQEGERGGQVVQFSPKWLSGYGYLGSRLAGVALNPPV